MNFVLRPLAREELELIFDKEALKVINYFLGKSIICQPEKLPDQVKELPIQIPKEHIEQWIVQALGNVIPAGAGSYPVDIISKDWGADIKMLSCKVDANGQLMNLESGETSLAQKFSDEMIEDYNTLDELFNNRKYDLILMKWRSILHEKYLRVIKEHNIKTIYYFIVLRAKSNFFLCGIEFNIANLENLSVKDKSTKNSVWINNFINDKLGNIKIYKAKKRLELRLKPREWISANLVIPLSTNFNLSSVNIREKIIKNELNQYIEKHLIPELTKITKE